MNTFYIGSLKLHDVNNPNDFWLKTPIQGLDSPEYRLSVYERSGEDGAVASSAFYGSRLVTLEGYIKGSSVAAYEDNRLAFSRALAINRNKIGVPVLTRFAFTTLAGATYFFDGISRKPVFANTHIDYCEFQVTIVVPDSQIYSATPLTSGAISLATATGVTFPVTFPMTFGGLIGGTYSVTNDGTMLSWPVLELTGGLTNPYILNVTTGQLMQLNYDLLGGQTITIDMAKKSIMLNGTSSLLGSKTNDSEWWGVQPGLNVFAFSSGSGGDTGNLTITFNAAYAGV